MSEYDCPRAECDGELEYGVFVDAREGIRGYGCSACVYAFTTRDLKHRGVIPME